jgi:8-oxo-dGTP pyrophosphatase MutT (NUDIX family)
MARPHHGVGIIVRNRAGTRFYLQQKDATYRRFPLAYSFFGGAIEPGETPAQALARELDEELAEAAAPLLAAGPALVDEYRVGPLQHQLWLFELIVDDAMLDTLAVTPVLEGERGAVIERERLLDLKFVWGLELVVANYLERV